MGRPQRIDTAGAWHHVMNRGAGRRIVFSNDRERELFTNLLGAINRRFDVETHTYCLMGNHYHLLARSAAGELSPAMQHLSANFTRAVNAWRGKDGPIFRSRFQSVLVRRHEQLLELCRYIHRNPIDLPHHGSLESYEWSSLGALLGLRASPPWLYRSEVLGWFDNDVQRLGEFVSGSNDVGDESGAALGNPTILQPDPAGAARGLGDTGHERAAPPAGSVLDRVERAVAVQWQRTIGDLRRQRSGSRNEARLAVFLIALDHAGLSASELADEYDIAPSSVRAGAARARSRRAADHLFATRVDLAVATLQHDVRRAPAA